MGGDGQTPDFQVVEAGERGHPREGKVASRVSLYWEVNIDRVERFQRGEMGGGVHGTGTRVRTVAKSVCGTMRSVCCCGVWDRSWGLLWATGNRQKKQLEGQAQLKHQAYKIGGIRY